MSSNERAFFIPLASANHVRALKKTEGKKGAEKTGKRERRVENENKNREKARLSEEGGREGGRSKNSARIMEYAASRRTRTSERRGEGEKTVSGLRMIEIDGRTIRPGPTNSRPKLRAVTPVASLTRRQRRKHGTKTGYRDRNRAANTNLMDGI